VPGRAGPAVAGRADRADAGRSPPRLLAANAGRDPAKGAPESTRGCGTPSRPRGPVGLREQSAPRD
jgi:hypothetical protein